ncbi:MAG TPA: F0F1 ATP synthase subunit delta [Solimonas sp.]
MADISIIARPYAKAVFELARSENKLGEWNDTLRALATVVSNPEVSGLLSHPALTRADLVAVLDKAVGGSVGAEGRSLLKLLVENGRLSAVPSMLSQYEALRAEAESRVDVEITSAAAVEKPQQEALAAAIRKRLGRDVVVGWKTDENLIAGALIRAGDLVIDGSVRGELEKLHTALAR